MGALDGRVAVITGAGRGLGREHALLFAQEGAAVVVNDLGGAADGSGSDQTAAEQVVAEIKAAGGSAVANADDVTDADGAQRMIDQAIEEFGALHILVNNAGILRDRTIVNMTDAEWDDVIKVHLRGHFMPTRAAARYWREQSKAGVNLSPSLINTSSTSGLYNNPGQGNYGAAKTGIATLTIIAQQELERYGVKANAIAPAARTRLTLSVPGATEEGMTAPEGEFDAMHPGNVSPFVAYLATADCPIKGRVFFVVGGEVHLFQPFAIVDVIKKDGAGRSLSWRRTPRTSPTWSSTSAGSRSSGPPPSGSGLRERLVRSRERDRHGLDGRQQLGPEERGHEEHQRVALLQHELAVHDHLADVVAVEHGRPVGVATRPAGRRHPPRPRPVPLPRR